MAFQFPSYNDWYAARRHDFSRHGFGLDGGEPGRPDPRGFDKARLKILICRLSPYEDVLASITHRVLLCALRAVPGVYVDLAFFPSEQDASLMRKDEVPFWLASGSKRAPADFDMVAISISVQQEAVHLPVALQASGLKLDFAGRMEDKGHPFVILGGHAAGSVPFLHGDANGPGTGGLVDAVCLGDGITWLQELAKRWLTRKKTGYSKQNFLKKLAKDLPGTYVPSLYRHIYRENQLAAIEPLYRDAPMPVEYRTDPMDVWLGDYDGAYIPFSEEELEETLPLAVGCVYRCHFCQTGWMRGELTASTRDSMLEAATRLKAGMVNSDLNLLASDACSVPALESVVDSLGPLFRHVSVKSLSVSSLVRRSGSLHLLQQLAKHEFTFGVEGISARLRAWLGKPATAGDLLKITGSLTGNGIRQLKLFFIITGLEEDSDLAELTRLLKSLRATAPSCRLITSFMPLFHAPFTPLQFAPIRAPSPDVEHAIASLVRQLGGDFRWSAYPDEIGLMNRLCRAGRAATPRLVDFSIRRGLRYYRQLESRLIREMENDLPVNSEEAVGKNGSPRVHPPTENTNDIESQVLEGEAVPSRKRTGCCSAASEERNQDSVFPWDDLRASVDKRALWRSYQKACRDLAETPESPATAGISGLQSIRSPGPVIRPPEPERWFFQAWITPEQACYPDHVIARSLFRGLFARWKDGVSSFQGGARVLRPAGTSGLVIVSAEFKHGTREPALGRRMVESGATVGKTGSPQVRPPADRANVLVEGEAVPSRRPALLKKMDLPEGGEDTLLFGVQWPALEPAEKILKLLKEWGVKFQTIRHGSSRWHIVGKAFRGKTGVTALQEEDQQTMLFCHARPALLENEFRSAGYPAGVIRVILASTGSPCPACRGSLFEVIRSAGMEDVPSCFDCLTKPG